MVVICERMVFDCNWLLQTTNHNQESSGGSTTQQSAPIRLGSLVNREAHRFHFMWQLTNYICDWLFFFSLIETAYFHSFTGIPLVTSISCDTSRTQPPERALSSAKTCSLFSLSLSCFSPFTVLELWKCQRLISSNETAPLSVFFTTKTLLNYLNFIQIFDACIIDEFWWLSHTILNYIIFYFWVKVHKAPRSDVLCRSLMVPGELWHNLSCCMLGTILVDVSMSDRRCNFICNQILC